MTRGVALALASAVFFPFATDAFELPHQLILAAASVVAFARGTTVDRKAGLAIAAFVLAAIATTATSISPALSFSALLTTLVLAAFVAPSEPLSFRPLLLTVWPIALYAVLQRVGSDPVRWSDVATWCGGTRPFASLGHPTQLGVWAALCVPLAIDEARGGSGRKGRWLFSATALVAASVCVMTLSRAGWLALAVGLAAMAVLGRKLSLRTWIAAAVVGGGALLLGSAAILERVQNFFVAPTRWQLWSAALQGFFERPLSGWGYDAFVLVAQKHQHPDAWIYEWGSTAAHAHGFLPQLLATQGLLGLVALLIGAAVWLRTLRLAEVRNAGTTAAALGFVAAECVAFANVTVSALGVLCLLAAFRVRSEALLIPRLGALPAAALVALTGAALGASALALKATRAGDVDALALASKLEPWNAGWHARRGALLERKEAIDAAHSAYARADALDVQVAQSAANLGRIEAKKKNAEASRTHFDRALALAPLDGRITLDAAERALELNELPRAEALLVRLLGHYSSYGPAWWALANLRLLQGRKVEERAALEAGLLGDWRDWPDGAAAARQRLVRVVFEGGDPLLAIEKSKAPLPEEPADICGAPARLGLR